MSWVGTAVSVYGAYSQGEAAKKAASRQEDAARAAAEGAKFDPYNVTGAFGTGTFNPEDNTAQVNLSPEMQAIQNQYQQQAGQFAGQGQTDIGALAGQGALGFMQGGMQADPTALAQSQFDKMQTMLAPSRGRSQEALESRLLQQGRLGSTGGGVQQGAQQEAFGQQDQQMMLNALQQGRADQQAQLGLGQQLGMFGQQQQDVGFNQAQARLGGMQGIDQQALSYLNMGSALGGRQAAAGQNAGAFGMEGAGAGTAALLGGAAGMTDAYSQVGSALGDYFNKPQDGGASYYGQQAPASAVAAGDAYMPAYQPPKY